jgi:hypothetical protein
MIYNYLHLLTLVVDIAVRINTTCRVALKNRLCIFNLPFLLNMGYKLYPKIADRCHQGPWVEGGGGGLQ